MNARLLTIAQSALDRALALDPEADAILEPLSGKRVEVHVVGSVSMHLLVEFSAARILLEQAAGQVGDQDASTDAQYLGAARPRREADVSISGSVSALLLLARGANDLPSTMQVKVYGDIALLQKMRDALARLRPDFEEPLARVLGDELAYPLSGALRMFASTARRTAREFGADVKEFLGEESRLLAARDSVQDFSDEVDRMRDALARLDKRVSRVAGQLERLRR